MVDSDTQFDIVVVGAGMVGATLAALLAREAYRIALVEPYFPATFDQPEVHDLRVSAISRFSRETLQDIGVWEAICEQRVSAYEDMHVWDAAGDGKIHFSAAELGEPNLGHIIENRLIQSALHAHLQKQENVQVFASALKGFQQQGEHRLIELEDGSPLTAQLLVGADGVHSRVRALAGIELTVNDYFQKGLVAVVETEAPHQQTAWQRFLDTGPLAFLPLSDGSCSIVWTLPADVADAHIRLEEEAFNQAIQNASDNRLGTVKLLSQRAAFPLAGRQAKQYVTEGIALVGDAAHTIHPLAGQGVNLGIKDAVELVAVLAGARSSLGGLSLLRRYERARRGENVIMEKTLEGFKVLFGNTLPPVQLLRNTGLTVADRIEPVKHALMRRAMGL